MRASDRRREYGAFFGPRPAPSPSPTAAPPTATSTRTRSGSRHRGVAAARRNEHTPEAPPSMVARCADGNGTLTPLFFSDELIDIARAKAICGKCSLRELCLAEALERGEAAGVWGAELFSEGRIVVKRPNGRPPKRPRPELVVDEMGRVTCSG